MLLLQSTCAEFSEKISRLDGHGPTSSTKERRGDIGHVRHQCQMEKMIVVKSIVVAPRVLDGRMDRITIWRAVHNIEAECLATLAYFKEMDQQHQYRTL
jgi:hypothetical protein